MKFNLGAMYFFYITNYGVLENVAKKQIVSVKDAGKEIELENGHTLHHHCVMGKYIWSKSSSKGTGGIKLPGSVLDLWVDYFAVPVKADANEWDFKDIQLLCNSYVLRTKLKDFKRASEGLSKNLIPPQVTILSKNTVYKRDILLLNPLEKLLKQVDAMLEETAANY